jgi:predicted metal-dependent hydrolase
VAGPPEGVVREPREALSLGYELLAGGRPFAAHEVFEDAWKTRPAEEDGFWRGLAQLAVGVTHAARGNRVGAVRLLRRGAANLAAYPSLHGVDGAAVRAWCADAVAAVEREVPVTLPPPPLPAQ